MILTDEELIHIRGEFINYMKKKNDTPEGRRETLETLTTHIKKNILQEHIDKGTMEVPENIVELVKEQFIKETNIVLKAL